jgi:hypothetical protein
MYEKPASLSYRALDMDLTNTKKRPGVPYKIQTPETTYIHVSSEQHMNELKSSSKDQLSLHAWANDVSESFSLQRPSSRKS